MTDNAAGKSMRDKLAEAVEQNDVEIVKELLLNGAHANDKGRRGIGNLGTSAALGFTEVASLLIAHGADVNERIGSEGTTPLMRAAHRGRVETAQLLIDKGADINATDSDGVTPLMKAVLCSQKTEAVRLLLLNGADAGLRDKRGLTALRLAQNGYQADMVQLLNEAPAFARRYAEEKARPHAIAVQNQRHLKSRALKPVIIREARP
jgi:ankyrin repeat protein